jgi:hypothetical protein
MIQFRQQPIQGWRFAWRQIQRVDTHRTIDISVLLGQRLHLCGVVGTHPDAQEVPHPTSPGSVQRSIEGATMGGEVKTIEVAMGIYEHGEMTTLKRK